MAGRPPAWPNRSSWLCASVDLSVSQYRLLVFLSDGPSQASALAERLIVSRPSVTALADGLVERGLVTRGGAEGDRRQVLHVLTDEGLRVLAEPTKPSRRD